MDEFAELVKSVRGATYVTPDNILKFNTPFNKSDYNDIGFTFDTNINNRVNITTQQAEHDEIGLFYDSFHVLDRQICWQYYNKETYDKSADEANMLLEAGITSAWFKIKWITSMIINNEAASPVVRVKMLVEMI